MWHKLLRNKYVKDKAVGSCVKKTTNSHFWKSLMNVKDTFLSFGSFKVKDGTQTRFWVDTWLGNQALTDKFPGLFNIVRRKQDYGAKVLSSIPLNISFRRNLMGTNLRDWHKIVASLHDVSLQEGRDVFVVFTIIRNFFRQIYV